MSTDLKIAEGTIETWVAEDSDALEKLRQNVQGAFRGKSEIVEMTVTALLARGHVLL